jgi:hypothetical protein
MGRTGNTRRLKINDQLTDALVPVFAGRLGAAQCQYVMRVMRIAVPQLGPRHRPSTVHALSARLQRGQIGPRIRFAQSDREDALAAGDATQILHLLGFGTELEQQRSGLAIGYPMRTHGCSRREQFFRHRIALERAAFVSSILPGPRHAYPAALGELAREIERDAHADVAGVRQRPGSAFFGDEFAHLLPQSLDFRRQPDRGEMELGSHMG